MNGCRFYNLIRSITANSSLIWIQPLVQERTRQLRVRHIQIIIFREPQTFWSSHGEIVQLTRSEHTLSGTRRCLVKCFIYIKILRLDLFVRTTELCCRQVACISVSSAFINGETLETSVDRRVTMRGVLQGGARIDRNFSKILSLPFVVCSKLALKRHKQST